ncbi:MAG: hypothetical protein ACF8TS_10875 [Maioricimonas sp. JB049]
MISFIWQNLSPIILVRFGDDFVQYARRKIPPYVAVPFAMIGRVNRRMQ